MTSQGPTLLRADRPTVKRIVGQQAVIQSLITTVFLVLGQTPWLSMIFLTLCTITWLTMRARTPNVEVRWARQQEARTLPLEVTPLKELERSDPEFAEWLARVNRLAGLEEPEKVPVKEPVKKAPAGMKPTSEELKALYKQAKRRDEEEKARQKNLLAREVEEWSDVACRWAKGELDAELVYADGGIVVSPRPGRNVYLSAKDQAEAKDRVSLAQQKPTPCQNGYHAYNYNSYDCVMCGDVVEHTHEFNHYTEACGRCGHDMLDEVH